METTRINWKNRWRHRNGRTQHTICWIPFHRVSFSCVSLSGWKDKTAVRQPGDVPASQNPRTAEDAIVPDRNAAVLESEYFDDFFANIPSRITNRYVRNIRKVSKRITSVSKSTGCSAVTVLTYGISSNLSLRESTAEAVSITLPTQICRRDQPPDEFNGDASKEKQITTDLESQPGKNQIFCPG